MVAENEWRMIIRDRGTAKGLGHEAVEFHKQENDWRSQGLKQGSLGRARPLKGMRNRRVGFLGEPFLFITHLE